MPDRSSKKPKRPRDANQLAHSVFLESIGEAEPTAPIDEGKDPAAVALGRKGGQKGAKEKTRDEMFDEVMKLSDYLEKIDPEKKGMLNFDVVAPYSHGKTPDPIRWESSLITEQK